MVLLLDVSVWLDCKIYEISYPHVHPNKNSYVETVQFFPENNPVYESQLNRFLGRIYDNIEGTFVATTRYSKYKLLEYFNEHFDKKNFECRELG